MTILHEAKQFIFRVIVLCMAMFKTFARDRCVLALSLIPTLNPYNSKTQSLAMGDKREGNWRMMNSWLTHMGWLVFLVMFASSTVAVMAAPLNGELFTYTQPNKETFKVRLWGDEFFAYQETEDGYLVVRDPQKGFFCYARVLPDGSDIVSTGVRVGQPKPVGLKPKQRLAKGMAFKKSLPRRALSGVDNNGRPINRGVKGSKKGVAPAIAPAADSTNQIQQSPQYAPDPTGDTTTGAETPTIQSAPTIDTRIGLVLLASFPDAQGEITKTPAQIESYFNAPTYTADGNATSIYGYFKIQSCGKLSYTNVVTAWFTAAHNKAYYTDPTASGRADELAKEGLAILAGNGFNFSQCDGNNDGEIDGVNVFYAGARVNSWSEGLWPRAGGFYWDPIKATGLTSSLVRFQITDMPASLPIGTVCHETGHLICGFPDLYQFDGNAADVGEFSGGGTVHPSHIDPYLRMSAGWLTATDVTLSGLTNHTLNVDGSNIVRYVNPNNPKEYFLFEMRGEVGYEGPYGGSPVEICPSKGLVVYHVREDGSNTNGSIFTAQNPNCDYSKPPMLMIVEDNPMSTITPWYDDMNPDGQDAFDTGDKVNSSTTPNFNFWSSNGRTIDSGIGIENIQVGTSTLTFSMYNRNPTAITASPRVVVANGTSALSVAATGMVSYSWSIVSGPGAVTFGTPNNRQTTVTFGSAIGNYLLRLTMSDGVKNFVSEIAIQVTQGVNDYLGYYKRFPGGNNWDTGWIEFSASQLLWRNLSGDRWNLIATADPEVFVTDNTCPYGAGFPFRFYRENDQVVKYEFIYAFYFRCNPIAHSSTVDTTKNTAVGVTLTATDVESEDLEYSVFTNPAHGTLSGTAPNLTYTPHNNYAGGDCFTYKATDGTYDSNVATVTIRINSVPVVDAGSNQTVTLAEDASVRNPVAGAYFEWNAAQDVDADNTWESTTAQTYNWTMAAGAQAPAAVTDSRFNVTKAYLFPAAKSIAQATFQNSVNENASATWEFLLDADSNDGLIMESGGGTDGIQFWIAGGVLKGLVRDSGKIATVSYTLKAGDMAGFIHVVYTINMLTNDFSLYVNGIAVNSVTWTGADWSDGNNAGLGRVAGTAPAGSVVDFSGKMALVRFYDGRALTPDEVIINCASLLRKVANVSLAANASDLDGGALTTTWSLVSTNPTGMNVSFGNNFALGSTATVVQSGIYVLRLTVSDGLVTVFDEVTITVSPVPLQNYTAWVNAGGFAHVLTDINPTANPDGDLMSNLMEFALGTDPTLQDSKSLAIDGSVNGLPLPVKAGGGVFEYYFVRRKDHGAAGSVSYTVQFSDDLSGFTNSAVSPSFVANSSANGDYELVKVPYPSGFRFGRLQIEPVP